MKNGEQILLIRSLISQKIENFLQFQTSKDLNLGIVILFVDEKMSDFLREFVLVRLLKRNSCYLIQNLENLHRAETSSKTNKKSCNLASLVSQ